MKNILVVDDEKTSQVILNKVLSGAGFDVTSVSSGSEALKKLKDVRFDVILTDLNMPKMNGIELTKKVLKLDPDIIVVLITAYGTIRSAVEAIRLGAFDYLTKPVNKKELLLAVERGMERISLIKENILLRQELEKIEKTTEFLTESDKIIEVLGEAKLVSNSDSSVLIIGENGTGKESLAKYIHDCSPRHKQQFVTVNCAVIPKHLLESELFGHVKGAFQGAENDHKGYFEIAVNGTIFLDEITNVDPLLQIKLLKVIQENQFVKQGDTKTQMTNARIMASTSYDIQKLIKTGNFNEDLYYKLNIFEFHLPSLKERPEDIIFYFKRFVSDFAYKNNKNIKEISPDVKKLLINYRWPGNISELKNIAERATILCEGSKITNDQLPDNIVSTEQYRELVTTNDFNKNKGATIKEFEINFIKKYLKLNKGNVTATARDISFHPVTLRQKIAKLGINPKEFKEPK